MITRSCYFADRNLCDRVISLIAIYVIMLFLVGPRFEPWPNSMIFFIGPGFDSQARLSVSGQCDSWPMSESNKTGNAHERKETLPQNLLAITHPDL